MAGECGGNWKFPEFISQSPVGISGKFLKIIVAVPSLHSAGIFVLFQIVRSAQKMRYHFWKFSNFPEFCSQKPLEIFGNFFNTIVARTPNLNELIFDLLKIAQSSWKIWYSESPIWKTSNFPDIFSRFSARGRNFQNFIEESYTCSHDPWSHIQLVLSNSVV